MMMNPMEIEPRQLEITRLLDLERRQFNLGCFGVWKRKQLLAIMFLVCSVLAISLGTSLTKNLHKHHRPIPPPDNYTVALKKAMLFFDAQMSGRLPEDKRIPWRGNSGLSDGSELPDVKGGLVGGYYDGGENIKVTFPMAFSMSMLSWSVIEYSHKYKAIEEYDHVREIIKWGTDYLLRTFDSSAPTFTHIYSQVGVAANGSTTQDDGYCWQRPEDMDYQRPVLREVFGAALAGEMTVALASASIVFRDDDDDGNYSQTLINGATMLFKFAGDLLGKRTQPYNVLKQELVDYNSTDYYDEYIWAAAWMYCATGDSSYLSLMATNEELPKHTHAFSQRPADELRVLSWDNKLPAAALLLTRIRMMLSPAGYPYEEFLSSYHDRTKLIMCSYLQNTAFFNWTRGGMIMLNGGRPRPLQYVANAAFISSLFIDYMEATDTPGWYGGPTYVSSDDLRTFTASQMQYILGANPTNISYSVGFGSRFPRHVYHRGASIPDVDGTKYSCTGGWKWRPPQQWTSPIPQQRTSRERWSVGPIQAATTTTQSLQYWLETRALLQR